MPGIRPLIEGWVADRLARREILPSSAESILSGLRGFSEFCPEEPSELSRIHVVAYREHLAATVALNTMRARLSHVRVLCCWLCTEGHVAKDPSIGLTRVKMHQPPPRGLNRPAMRNLERALPDRRAQLVVSLMVQEGLRVGEVARLRVEDIDTYTGEIRVFGKGEKTRVVPLTEATSGRLVAYLEDNGHRSGLIVRSKFDNTGLTVRHVSRLVGVWMQQAGIKTRPYDGVSAHALRHTCASDALDKCGNIKTVSELLGHASIVTTQRYVRPESVARMRSALEGRDYTR